MSAVDVPESVLKCNKCKSKLGIGQYAYSVIGGVFEDCDGTIELNSEYTGQNKEEFICFSCYDKI